MESKPVESLALGESLPAFFDLLPPGLQEKYLLIPKEWLTLSEGELKRVCYPDLARCTIKTDQRLRMSFWNEYEYAITEKRSMSIANIYSPVMNSASFYQCVCINQKRLAWIFCRPIDYQIRKLAQLNDAEKELERILAIPIESRPCRCHYQCVCKQSFKKEDAAFCACKPSCICPVKYDAKIMKLKIDLHRDIELRVMGAIPQIINQNQKIVSYNVNKNTTQNIPSGQPQQALPLNVEELQRKRIELEEKLVQLTSGTSKSVEEVPEAEVIDAK